MDAYSPHGFREGIGQFSPQFNFTSAVTLLVVYQENSAVFGTWCVVAVSVGTRGIGGDVSISGASTAFYH